MSKMERSFHSINGTEHARFESSGLKQSGFWCFAKWYGLDKTGKSHSQNRFVTRFFYRKNG